MELGIVFLAFTLLWRLSTAMQCYKCDPEHTYNSKEVLCEHFDGGSDFVTECEHSNMCFKRVTTLDLGNGLVTKTTQRGCASQTMSGDQVKINGKWRRVDTIYDVYTEGCGDDPSDIERATTTLHCYCSGDLCNGAGIISISKYLLLIIILGFVIS